MTIDRDEMNSANLDRAGGEQHMFIEIYEFKLLHIHCTLVLVNICSWYKLSCSGSTLKHVEISYLDIGLGVCAPRAVLVSRGDKEMSKHQHIQYLSGSQFLIPYLFSSKILRTILINRQNLSTAKIWRITCKMTCKSPWHAVHRAKSTRHLSPHPQTDEWADASHCHVLVYHNTLQFGPADSLHTVWTGHLESLPSVRDGVEMGQVI